MDYAQQLTEQNVRLSLQMRGIVDKAKAENNRGLTSEEAEQFDRLEKDYSANEQSITRAKKTDKIENDLRSVDPDRIAQFANGGGTNDAKDGDKKYASTFSTYMRQGADGLDAEQRSLLQSNFIKNSAQATTPGSAGGYLVPTTLGNKLDEAQKYYGGILGEVGTLETSTGNPFDYPTVNDTSNIGRIISQNTQVTNTGFTFGQVPFTSYIFSSDIVLIPLALLQDSQFDIDSLTGRLLGSRLGRLLNNKLTVGAGTTEPTGIVTAAVAAGNIYTTATGQTSSIIYDDFVKLEHKVDPLYRAGAKYMFNDTTLQAAKLLKDGQNRPLWQPGLSASFATGAEPTILNHPYAINNDMASLGAGNSAMLFGDITKYLYRKVAGGTSLLRLAERYADYLQVGFIAWMRADGNLVDAGTHPVAVLQNAAS